MNHETVATNAKPFTVTNGMVVRIALPMTIAFVTTPLIGLTDTAIVGQAGRAAMIGGLAVGAVIFDIVFAAFNFLRSGTTGLVAQASGRADALEEQAIFWRALILGLSLGLATLLLSPLIIAGGLAFMNAGPDVAEAARTYVSIRMLSAPAALANYAILGFVLGRGEATLGLALQAGINGFNILLSLWLGLGLDLGIVGVAWGTVAAETLGALIGTAYVLMRFDAAGRPSWSRIAQRAAMVRLFALNRDIMIRTLALLCAFAFFTRAGVQFGPVALAANAVLLNFFMFSSFYLDGLATAAEQIGGRAIGANYRPAFDRAARLTVFWGFVLSAVAAIGLLIAGPAIIDLMTTAENVRETARTFLPWAALSALSGVLAFQMDGVYIGATWSRDMRNMMLVSLAVFLLLVFLAVPYTGNHGLWAALNIFLGLRGLTLLANLKRRADATFKA